jgi:mRNA-degrading endonuclease RelE of RelBE toxin-antitoxin system
MKSATLPSFWKAYRSLDRQIRARARKAFRLWAENPFHPSLHFKCINTEEDIWSVRVTLGYRALGVLEGDTVTWFWIGSHDDYERFFSS